ncbi:hypothetical protein ABPG74_012753 [Tetrahymena malaccensis]
MYPNDIQMLYNNDLDAIYNQIQYNNIPMNQQPNHPHHQCIKPSFLELEANPEYDYDNLHNFDSPNYNRYQIECYDQVLNYEINQKNNLLLQENQFMNFQQHQTIYSQNSLQQPQQENLYTTIQTQQRNPIETENFQKKFVAIANNQQQTTQNIYQSNQVTNEQIKSQQKNEVMVVEKEARDAQSKKKTQRRPSNEIYTAIKGKEDETKNLLRNYGDQLKKEIRQLSLEKRVDSFWIEQIIDQYIEKKSIEDKEKFRESFILRYKNFSFSNFQVVREEWDVSPQQPEYHLKNVYRQVCYHFFTQQPLRYIYKNTNKINKRNQRFTHLYYLKVFIQGILDPKTFQKFKDSTNNKKKSQNKNSEKNNQDQLINTLIE